MLHVFSFIHIAYYIYIVRILCVTYTCALYVLFHITCALYVLFVFFHMPAIVLFHGTGWWLAYGIIPTCALYVWSICRIIPYASNNPVPKTKLKNYACVLHMTSALKTKIPYGSHHPALAHWGRHSVLHLCVGSRWILQRPYQAYIYIYTYIYMCVLLICGV